MLRNNLVNYFEVYPTFDKDCLHFWKCDTSAPSFWRIPINKEEAVVQGSEISIFAWGAEGYAANGKDYKITTEDTKYSQK